jgi:hypothetical protein
MLPGAGFGLTRAGEGVASARQRVPRQPGHGRHVEVLWWWRWPSHSPSAGLRAPRWETRSSVKSEGEAV